MTEQNLTLPLPVGSLSEISDSAWVLSSALVSACIVLQWTPCSPGNQDLPELVSNCFRVQNDCDVYSASLIKRN